jgi:hypothetical protein
MRATRGVWAALVLGLAWTPAVQAGPWPVGTARVYAKLGGSYLRSTTLANPDASQVRIPRFTKRDVQLYAAFGLNERLSLSASLPVSRRSTLADFGSESGLGDAQVALQVQLTQRRGWVLATRASVQAPTGDETRAEGLLPTGSGVWEGEWRLSLGRSFGAGRGWGFVEAGHQWRETLRDGFVYEGQAGWRLNERLSLAWNVRGLRPYDLSARGVALGSFVGVGDRVSYLAFGPSALVKLGGGFGAQVDVTGAAFERNLATGTTFSIGLSYSGGRR